jgi:ADP-ribose pyrophosphatase YjhB (NUDIX family)
MSSEAQKPGWIPREEFKLQVKNGITPSVNLIVQDMRDRVLFVMRKNEPMINKLWVLGGRVHNGEQMSDAVDRIAVEEAHIRKDCYEVLHISDRYNNEIFNVKDLDPAGVAARYHPDTKFVHYWGSVAGLRLTRDIEDSIELDDQSSGYEWLKEIPTHRHPYLLWYFKTLEEAGYPTLSLR